MAQLAPLFIASTVASSVMSGIQKRDAANETADQMEDAAGSARATSQREAIEARRQARLAQSRALAVSAAGGGGASDPTVVNLMADLAGEGEFDALRAMYEGESRAVGLERQAENTRRSGRRSMISTILSGATQAGMMSMQQKYG